MAKKIRNNSVFIEKSIVKVNNKIDQFNKDIKESIKQQEINEKKQKETLEQLEKINLFLENLGEMSYNDLRKYASEVGLTVYQRTKDDLKANLKEHYERLKSETHQLFRTQDME